MSTEKIANVFRIILIIFVCFVVVGTAISIACDYNELGKVESVQ
jgi:hypothetical protein